MIGLEFICISHGRIQEISLPETDLAASENVTFKIEYRVTCLFTGKVGYVSTSLGTMCIHYHERVLVC